MLTTYGMEQMARYIQAERISEAKRHNIWTKAVRELRYSSKRTTKR